MIITPDRVALDRRFAAAALAGVVLLSALCGCKQKADVTGLSLEPRKLLFRSGFEGSTILDAPGDCYGTGCWQNIVGKDSSTDFAWPPKIWGGGRARFQLLADAGVDATTIDNYMVNQIQTVTGHDGNPTRALYSEIKQSGCCGTKSQGGRPAQNPLMIQPVGETGDLYISYWIRLQPDLVRVMDPPNPNWRVLFEWKTGTPGGGDDGDYRVIVSLVTWGVDGPLSWHITGDNVASDKGAGSGKKIYWEKYTTTTAQTLGHWMKFEVFWHRSSGADGRVWMAVDGQVIVDKPGRNRINAPINRIMLSTLYSSTAYPIYQWIDDVEIWDGFPPDAAPH